MPALPLQLLPKFHQPIAKPTDISLSHTPPIPPFSAYEILLHLHQLVELSVGCTAEQHHLLSLKPVLSEAFSCKLLSCKGSVQFVTQCVREQGMASTVRNDTVDVRVEVVIVAVEKAMMTSSWKAVDQMPVVASGAMAVRKHVGHVFAGLLVGA